MVQGSSIQEAMGRTVKKRNDQEDIYFIIHGRKPFTIKMLKYLFHPGQVQPHPNPV